MQEAAQITSMVPIVPHFASPWPLLLWEISKGLTTTTKWRFYFFSGQSRLSLLPRQGNRVG